VISGFGREADEKRPLWGSFASTDHLV